jgi:hypothetical protein
MQINGNIHDGLDAWHILNSDLKKSLNFVTPWFRKRLKMWKHLSGSEPAFYNAVDADAAGSNMRGTIELLKKNNLYKVYQEFVLELDPVYSAMTRAGMPIDATLRRESAQLLTEKKQEILERISAAVPIEARPVSPKGGYKKPPADLTGCTEVVFDGTLVKRCSHCGVEDPKKAHFKSKILKTCDRCGTKWTAAHVKVTKKGNPCAGAGCAEHESNECVAAAVQEKLEGTKRWAKVLPFLPSTKGLLRYGALKKHKVIWTGKQDDRKATMDEKALKKLIGAYPDDTVYPDTLEYRDVQTIGTRYVGLLNSVTGQPEGGFPVGRDHRIHGIFRHNPSTLRSSMTAPNLQNIPRGDDSDYQRLVKRMFVASPGQIFVARDFSGIEAVLVGYEARSQSYTRLAKIDVHSYFTGQNLVRQGVLTPADAPSLAWSDADLYDYGAKLIKKRFKQARDIGKRCIHAGNYRVGPKLLSETYPQWFPKIKDAAAVLAFYYEVFPEIEKWHEQLCLQVDRSAVTVSAFGHAHRFYQVLNWSKETGDWTWSYGDDSKRLIAFHPQSNAALIGKRALKRCFYGYPDSMAQWLRLWIHDEMFVECPEARADEADAIMQHEMEQPIPELRLPPEWGMGEYLTIQSEGKRGRCWADMK